MSKKIHAIDGGIDTFFEVSVAFGTHEAAVGLAVSLADIGYKVHVREVAE